MQSPEQAFEAWGSYDQDDPYPLFAEVRELGALHEVTLVDGHDAWLVTRHDEAKAQAGRGQVTVDWSGLEFVGHDVTIVSAIFELRSAFFEKCFGTLAHVVGGAGETK